MYADLMTLLVSAAPDDNDVVAGPIGALVFVGLIVATALLCWSFVRQLRKANRARDEGVLPSDRADREAAETAEREAAAGEDDDEPEGQ